MSDLISDIENIKHPKRLTVDDLKAILKYYEVAFPHSAPKSDLIQIFKKFQAEYKAKKKNTPVKKLTPTKKRPKASSSEEYEQGSSSEEESVPKKKRKKELQLITPPSPHNGKMDYTSTGPSVSNSPFDINSNNNNSANSSFMSSPFGMNNQPVFSVSPFNIQPNSQELMQKLIQQEQVAAQHIAKLQIDLETFQNLLKSEKIQKSELEMKIQSMEKLNTVSRNIEINPKEITLETTPFTDDSSIYRGKWKDQLVVVKYIKIKISSFFLEEAKKIITKLTDLYHPNLNQILGYYQIQPDKLFFVMEYGFRNLDMLLHTMAIKFPISTQIKIARDIANGLAYLHCQKPKIIVRDLKSQNILLNENWTAKISNFGLSSFKDLNMNFPQYVSPELLENFRASEKSDSYSFGMILYELVSNLKPFHTLNAFQLIKEVLSNKRPSLVDSVSNSPFKALIKQCWDQNPSERPSTSDIIHQLEQLITKYRDEFLISEWNPAPDFKQLKQGWNFIQSKCLAFDLSNQPIYSVGAIETYKLDHLLRQRILGSSLKLLRAFAIEHEALKRAFQQEVLKFQNKVTTNPQYFHSEFRDEFSIWRLSMLSYLDFFSSQFLSYETDPRIQILPLFHIARTEQSALQICEHGFSNSAILEDGWLGKGIYFSSNLEYLIQKYGKPNDKGEYFVLFCYVILGNAYPVIENPETTSDVKGKGCKIKYDSHFSVSKDPKLNIPCEKDDPDFLHHFDEFCVFQQNQILVNYVLTLQMKQ